MSGKISLTVWLCFVASIGHCEIVIKQWLQKHFLTERGQIVQADIKAKVEGISKNQFHESWGFGLPSDQKVFLMESSMPDRSSEASVLQNNLKFTFPEALNGQELRFSYRYFVATQPSSDPYMRREWVYLPGFAEGSTAELRVWVPEGMILIDAGRYLKKGSGGEMVWSGRIPIGGINSDLRLTPETKTFQVLNRVSIQTNRELTGLDVTMPEYFSQSPDIVEKNSIQTEPVAEKITHEREKIRVGFSPLKVHRAVILAKTVVRVVTGSAFPRGFGTGKDYMFLDSDEKRLLKEVVRQIKKDLSLSRDPDYQEVSGWVYQFMTFDGGLAGQQIELSRMLKDKKGVCVHFSKLYEKIMRYLRVPAVKVNGMAWDQKNRRFSGHAWVAVRPFSEWIAVDPTWNLSGGCLPVSHIYLSTDYDVTTNCRYPANSTPPEVNTELSTEVDCL